MQLSAEEQYVISELRYSAKAAVKLLPTIQHHISVAKEEMKRVGIPSAYVDADGELIQEAAVTYCRSKMDDIQNREGYEESFRYQIDNLRKSYRTIGVYV